MTAAAQNPLAFFRCTELNATLTVRTCSAQHAEAQRKTANKPASAAHGGFVRQPCADCALGKAHAAGKATPPELIAPTPKQGAPIVKQQQRVCIQCLQPFPLTFGNQRFCSRTCAPEELQRNELDRLPARRQETGAPPVPLRVVPPIIAKPTAKPLAPTPPPTAVVEKRDPPQAFAQPDSPGELRRVSGPEEVKELGRAAAERLVASNAEAKPEERACLHCKAPIEATAHARKVFCKPACGLAAWKIKNGPRTNDRRIRAPATCQHCGTTLPVGAHGAKKYCSPKCKLAADTKRIKDSRPGRRENRVCECGATFEADANTTRSKCITCLQAAVAAPEHDTAHSAILVPPAPEDAASITQQVIAAVESVPGVTRVEVEAPPSSPGYIGTKRKFELILPVDTQLVTDLIKWVEQGQRYFTPDELAPLRAKVATKLREELGGWL